MKKVVLLLVLLPIIAFSQFKESGKLDINSGLFRSATSSFFTNFLNSTNFQMKHSVGMSYSSFGNQGVALGTYTNTMMFKFADNLSFRTDISFVNSPYSSMGKNFSNSLNGVYLSNAELNYKPTENSLITIQYRQIPANYYNSYSPYSYYNRYSNPFDLNY